MNSGDKITDLFQINYPLVQAGMVWCSGWRLASAVSNAGGLGLLGSGSMRPDVLKEHIVKCRQATGRPFGVNVPLLYPEIDRIIKIIVEEGVGIVFTSAGNPATWTPYLKDQGITVVHVVSSVRFAVKAVQAGVDAIVAEGFEAGGHNGREETTTFVLVPLVRAEVDVPLLAAGGISTGRTMLAAQVLGADGVQIGSRFAASVESSAHDNFKAMVARSAEGDTILTLKQLVPVRMLKNEFYWQVEAAERRGATPEELKTLLGSRRSRRGIFEGDTNEGELEIGQVAASIRDIKPAAVIVEEIMTEYKALKEEWCQ